MPQALPHRKTETLDKLRLFLLEIFCCGLLAGCSGGSQANLPPIDDTRGGRVSQGAPASSRPSLVNKKNMVILAGAAALYYLYKKHQKASATSGPDSQYYLSKNGRVYYRDAQHRAHWVTAPSEGISVPASEAADYQDYQGYNNQNQGRSLAGIGRD